MYSATSTSTNNFISISIRNITFELGHLDIDGADKVLNLLGQLDDNAQFKSQGWSVWSDPSKGIDYKFTFSYQEETQTRQYRKLLFRLRLEYPDIEFDKWGF